MKKSENPEISVIIPLYNKEQFILETISSVLKQTFTNFELIIVDDGSSDKSLELVKKIKDDRITILEKLNGGVSDARNFGIKRSNGKWIFLLDADDMLYKVALETLMNLKKKFPGKLVYTGNFCTLKSNGLLLQCKERFEGVVNNNPKKIWLNKVFPRTGNTLLSKSIFNKIGYFNSKISYFEDMEFNLRFIEGFKIVYTPIPIFVYNTTSSDLSVNWRPLFKEFSYYATFKGFSFYSKLILGRIVYFSLLTRLILKDKTSVYYLLKRYFFNLFYVLCSMLLGKILKVYR
ncbi:glycosyltransferase family 2 protein [Aestuariibaculum sediminum]|uniref:Glycosyltransferase n=1 Tax=Aestuariibaculum sediminum TaxID=2770637 RepID=A0A8J6U8B1_9FLAO|nr:glycosyltransferase [Aestuariibaculum sediminum]MBD0831212.1 glycosyltransferase [Aestuariibaculum sediminum]